MKNQPVPHVETAVAVSPKTAATSALAKPFLHLFERRLNDMYVAEQHMLKTLPKLVKAVASHELREAFEDQLEKTTDQVERLEHVYIACELKAGKGSCDGIEGITVECDDVIGEYPQGSLRDAALIIDAQKAKHYEIAAYGSLRSMAKVLKCDAAVALLEQTLREEEATDKDLTRLSITVNDTASKDAQGSMDGQRTTKHKS